MFFKKKDYKALIERVEVLEKEVFVLHTKNECTEKLIDLLTSQLKGIYNKAESVKPTILKPLRQSDKE